jgi:hypothetical protein
VPFTAAGDTDAAQDAADALLAVFDAATSDPAWLHTGNEVRWVGIERCRLDEREIACASGALRREARLDG